MRDREEKERDLQYSDGEKEFIFIHQTCGCIRRVQCQTQSAELHSLPDLSLLVFDTSSSLHPSMQHL
jgi:hypothetical protein